MSRRSAGNSVVVAVDQPNLPESGRTRARNFMKDQIHNKAQLHESGARSDAQHSVVRKHSTRPLTIVKNWQTSETLSMLAQQRIASAYSLEQFEQADVNVHVFCLLMLGMKAGWLVDVFCL